MKRQSVQRAMPAARAIRYNLFAATDLEPQTLKKRNRFTLLSLSRSGFRWKGIRCRSFTIVQDDVLAGGGPSRSLSEHPPLNSTVSKIRTNGLERDQCHLLWSSCCAKDLFLRPGGSWLERRILTQGHDSLPESSTLILRFASTHCHSCKNLPKSRL